MPFDPQERATFVALMHHLGPGADRDPVIGFVRDHWAQSLDEIGARPGWDQVRAGLLRLAPELLDPPPLEEVRQAARAALDAYPEDAASADPALLLARHPAWVGLSQLELEPDRPRIDRAVQLASAGFQATSRQAIGRGEILWAMAEQAEEAGWHDRARQLLRAAQAGPFHDPDHAARVKLLLGLRLVEDGEVDDGSETLTEVAADALAEGRARVHALWVLAALQRKARRIGEAQELLERALCLLDQDDEPEIVEQIRATLADLTDGDPTDGDPDFDA